MSRFCEKEALNISKVNFILLCEGGDDDSVVNQRICKYFYINDLCIKR